MPPGGGRAVGTVLGPWESVTRIAARRRSGMVAPSAFGGAAGTPAFPTDVEQAPAPQLRPDDVVLRDNLTPPEGAHVERAIAPAGAEVVPSPPYRSGRTPIAELWSEAKGFLRSAATRTTDTLSDAMGPASRAVRPEGVLGWFRFCGGCSGPGVRSPDPGHSTDGGFHPCCSSCANRV